MCRPTSCGRGLQQQWVKTAHLLEARFRVIAPDLWGFGGTERWPADQVLTHDHQALLVARVIQDRCKERVHLVGHSYGGATAMPADTPQPRTRAHRRPD